MTMLEAMMADAKKIARRHRKHYYGDERAPVFQSTPCQRGRSPEVEARVAAAADLYLKGHQLKAISQMLDCTYDMAKHAVMLAKVDGLVPRSKETQQ